MEKKAKMKTTWMVGGESEVKGEISKEMDLLSLATSDRTRRKGLQIIPGDI